LCVIGVKDMLDSSMGTYRSAADIDFLFFYGKKGKNGLLSGYGIARRCVSLERYAEGSGWVCRGGVGSKCLSERRAVEGWIQT
jgi:hypothetical protein